MEVLSDLTDEQALDLLYDWDFWSRPDQRIPDGDWHVWLALAGRGWGKTRTGAETVRRWVREGTRHFVLAAPTAADIRDVMVEGESGLLGVFPPHQRPHYEPSKRRITFHTGATAVLLSADTPEAFRGKQCEKFWCDELASWRRPDAWDQLLLGNRLGRNPQGIVTTTPKPLPHIRELAGEADTHITRGSTYDNAANLASKFLKIVERKYEGTRLGRQELHGEILTDVEGALWTHGLIERNRVSAVPDGVTLIRIVVAIDPAVSATPDSDETGIIVAGLGSDGHVYVLEDRSGRHPAFEWAKQAAGAYHKHRADRIVGEVNNGGDLVEVNVRTVDTTCAYTAVHASRGKLTRAEPVAALYEKMMVHHVTPAPEKGVGNLWMPTSARVKERNQFSELEDQLCTWVPGLTKSPDRLDALVWAVTELVISGDGGAAWDGWF